MRAVAQDSYPSCLGECSFSLGYKQIFKGEGKEWAETKLVRNCYWFTEIPLLGDWLYTVTHRI